MKKKLSLVSILSLILIIFFDIAILFGICSLIKRGNISFSQNDNTTNSMEEAVTNTPVDWSRVIISCFGDSITNGGYLPSDGITYPNLLKKQLNNALCFNYGIGGSACASRPSSINDTGMVLRYNEINRESDIIIVMCGVNDALSNVPLGSIESSDITTYYGALNTLCSGLKESYPNSWVFFMTNFNYSNSEKLNEIGVTYKTYYRTAVQEVCQKHSIDVFDTFNEVAFDSTNLCDAVHPNQDFLTNVWTPAIAQFIKTNYKQK